MLEQIRKPWTPEQVAALNRYQQRGEFHPFTCGNGGHDHGVLRATPDGWVCDQCDYTQGWAHAFMAAEQEGASNDG